MYTVGGPSYGPHIVAALVWLIDCIKVFDFLSHFKYIHRKDFPPPQNISFSFPILLLPISCKSESVFRACLVLCPSKCYYMSPPERKGNIPKARRSFVFMRFYSLKQTKPPNANNKKKPAK